tara:strand:- start:1024 stop:1917 length:894 start_codon:yes stop_codon:yes gene_type:complete
MELVTMMMIATTGAVMLFGAGSDDKKMQGDPRWPEFKTAREPHKVELDAAIAAEEDERGLYRRAKAKGDQSGARHHAGRAYAFSNNALESKRAIERLARKILVTAPAGVKCVRDAASTAIGKLPYSMARELFDELNTPHVKVSNAKAAARGARAAADDARKSRMVDPAAAEQLASIADDLEETVVEAQAAADAYPIDTDKLDQILDCPDAILAPCYSVLVTDKILKGRRWPEAEQLIATDANAAFEYSAVIGRRWKDGEPAIMGNQRLWTRYSKKHGIDGTGATSAGSSRGTQRANL